MIPFVYLFEKLSVTQKHLPLWSSSKTSFDVYLQRVLFWSKNSVLITCWISTTCTWNLTTCVCLSIDTTFQSWVVSGWHVLEWSFWILAGICSVWSLPMPVSFKLFLISSSNVGTNEIIFTTLGQNHSFKKCCVVDDISWWVICHIILNGNNFY